MLSVLLVDDWYEGIISEKWLEGVTDKDVGGFEVAVRGDEAW